VNTIAEQVGTAIGLKNILFATDFSGVSEAALPYVTALSLRYGSTVHVAHVLPEVTFLRPGAPDPGVMGSIYEDAHSNAQEKIQRLSGRLKGYPHKTYIRHGNVAEAVTELVRELEINLLVVGTHGRTGLGKLVMGSVAEEIFRQAGCPVLSVGPRVPSAAKVLEARRDRELQPPQIKFHRILYATDFKPDAAHGSSYAASLAREFQTELTLLHVIEDYGDHLEEHPGPIDVALRKLEGLVAKEEGLRYRPGFVAEYGVPAEVILQTAADYEADLIVLGVRPATGHLGAVTHLVSSTAYKVVVGANCPVLTVRR
jgi:nucleotide-binding universal stress UspA family protein